MKVAIVLFTYNRLDYAKQTLEALFKHLKYTEFIELFVHIADDGSDEAADAISNLLSIAQKYVDLAHLSYTNSQRKGYGGSYNIAMRRLIDEVDFVLPLEDDWVLTEDLDLDNLVRLIQDEPKINCIRLGYIGYFHPLFAEFIYVRNQHLLILDPESPSQYVFSGHPRLERISYTESIGPWTEGIGAGATELDVCSRPQSRIGVAWPVDLIRPSGGLFVHIGAHSIKDAVLTNA